jgi:DNA-directed RNA polymerase specialized sigma24 family protein
MDRINDDGMLESYEPESPANYFAGDEYLMRRKVFLSIVALKEPNLTEITDLLTKEYSQTDISKELGLPISTVNSRRKRVGKLYNASRGDIFY